MNRIQLAQDKVRRW